MINSNNYLSVYFLTQDGKLQMLSSPEKNSVETNNLASDLSCCVCRILYEKPLKIRKCEHALCANCFLQISNKKCPECRIDLSSEGNNIFTPPTRVENSIIDNIKTSYNVYEQEVNEQTKRQAATQNSYHDTSITKANLQITTRGQHSTTSSLLYNPYTTSRNNNAASSSRREHTPQDIFNFHVPLLQSIEEGEKRIRERARNTE